MAAKIIDGKAIAQEIRTEVKNEAAALREKHGIVPGLAVVLVGDDSASKIYVRNKKRACDECGFNSFEHTLPGTSSEADVLGLIDKLNRDPAVHGILCQLPVPKHINENKVLLAINPDKDVDGIHPMNVGRFMTLKDFDEIRREGLLLPCTPAGCIELLDRTGVELKGAHAVMVGRSNIVGKPLAMLLMAKHATVTICHSRTRNLPEIVRQGDVVVAAIGQPKFVKGDWIKLGAAVIDVGMNRLEKLVGDVDFEAASERASAITPVPGGVGPMTIAMLMKNTLTAARNSTGIKG